MSSSARRHIFRHPLSGPSRRGPARGSVAIVVAAAIALLGAVPSLPAVAAEPAGPPGVVIDHVPASTQTFVGSPGLAILPDGTLVASHDFFGPGSTEWTSARTDIFASGDAGQSWQKIATIDGAFWSNLFAHRGRLYLLGTTRHHGLIVIRRSDDGGATWSEPTDARHGLLTDSGEYHTAPMPVLVHAGRLWRAFEDASGGTAWGHRYRAMMLSAPVDADLLDRESWTFSNALPRDPAWLAGRFGGWLEGSAVVDSSGRVLDILRVDVPAGGEQAAIVSLSDDGRVASFDPETGFIDFPGGAKKFTIRRDPLAAEPTWWTLATAVPPAVAAAFPDRKPATIRNTLVLMRSTNLRDWEIRTVLLHHPDVERHGFQYVEWLFDGDDLVAACRTAHDDAHGGAQNNHDANYLTFHRVRKFRGLSMSDATVDPRSLGW